MSEFKGTPGPWLVDDRFHCHIRDENYRGIANTGGHSSNFDAAKIEAENVANTRAIAAVPQMIEALWVLTEHNALHFGENHSSVIQGRAALDAATKE